MFKHIKTYVFLIIAVMGILGGIYWAGEKGKLADTPLKNFDHKKLNIFSEEDAAQIKVLSNRVQESGEQVQQVLGETIEADEEEKLKSIQGNTLKYARYIYCKQVVEDWEAEYNQSTED